MQEFRLRVVTDVVFAEEPLQLADAYDHLRVTHDSNGSDDDAWLQATIPAVREFCEGELGRSLATKTIEIATNKFPTVSVRTSEGPTMDLPFGPVRSITSVTYLRYQTDSNGDTALDSNGDKVTETATVDASTYEIDAYASPNRLLLAFGKSWPTDAIDWANSVKVRYVAGYVPAPDSDENAVLPKAARSAMLLMLGHLYENREAVNVGNIITQFPLGVQSLLELVPHRERLGIA